jgi:hypothetical protein
MIYYGHVENDSVVSFKTDPIEETHVALSRSLCLATSVRLMA